jgi:hypothetical protein
LSQLRDDPLLDARVRRSIYAIVGGALILWMSLKVRSLLRAGGIPAVGATS